MSPSKKPPRQRPVSRKEGATDERFRLEKPAPFEIEDAAAHWFELRLPDSPLGEAVLAELFAPGSGGSDRPTHRGLEITKGRVPLALWLQIDDRIRAEFNGRLRRRNLAPGTWGSGVNRLGVHLGWELTLLFWGAEGAPAEHARRVFSAWSALAPEERWWLYNQAATFGGAERDHDTAWRRALRLIFQDVAMAPASDLPGGRQKKIALPPPPGLFDDAPDRKGS